MVFKVAIGSVFSKLDYSDELNKHVYLSKGNIYVGSFST
jgi:hypothetical protein